MSEPTGPSPTNAGDELLSHLVDDFLRRHRAGEQPSVDEYAVKHPGLAERIRELFPAMLAMEQPGLGATLAGLPPSERIGAIIGRYKLLERIGEGGFGVVYMAEQLHPVRRKVALKVIKPGFDGGQVIARFEAERQALALMDHENIARVLDAGATDAGRPYFVMELVHGVPITEYCDTNQLAPRERLELFVQVCRAVQHAHTKGIIHRDIKPTNVLVTLHEGVAVPKVIDFGVAKATGQQQLTDKTLFTNFAQMVGTPLYMSPEQAEMSSTDVDTRSDVYSLGVLLYELLTGTTPLDKERIKQAAFDEVRRIIREEEPPRPSTRLSTVAALPSIAANRGLEPKKLSGLVRGELDWIVMKAMEKERSRRYETANGFARDIERYLCDEPVLAGPPTVRYRSRKFARRHWRVLTAALAFVLLLVTAVVTLSVALVEVNRQRLEKEAALQAEARRRKQTRAALDAMSSQIIEDWLSKQTVLLPEHRRFLEEALRAYEEFAADTGQQEETRAGVANAYSRVGWIRVTLGDHTAAEAAYERSRDLYAGLVAGFPGVPAYLEGLGVAHLNLAAVYSGTGRGREAEAAYGQATTLFRNLSSESPDVHRYRKQLASTLSNQAFLLGKLARDQEAEATYGQAVAILKQLAAEFPTEPDYRADLAFTYVNLGILLTPNAGRRLDASQTQGRFREGVASLTQAVAIYEQLASEFPAVVEYRFELAKARNNLGNCLRDAGEYARAEEMFRASMTTRRQLVADFPAVPSYRKALAVTLSNFGILLKNTDRVQEADEAYRQALAIHKQLATDFPTVSEHQNQAAGAMVNLARLLLDRKDADGARRLLEEAVPYHQAALKANARHPEYRYFYRNNRWRLTETLIGLKDHAAAAAMAGEFLESAVEQPRDAYTTAGLLAGCVRLATQDERLTDAERKALAKTYGDRAIAALRQAVEKGANEVAQMKDDPSLDPLRHREDFQKLLAESQATTRPQPHSVLSQPPPGAPSVP